MKMKFVVFIGVLSVLLTGAILLHPLISAAQSAMPDIPDHVGYQGRLTDAGGTAQTGSFDMMFCIYDQATMGVDLWCETQTAVSVTDGVFSVQLGSAASFPSGLFDEANRYLGITIVGDPDGELVPRIAITSNGYAFTAANSDLLDGHHASDFALATHTHATAQPAFSAAAIDNSAQSIPSNIWTKVVFGDERFDVTNDFNNSTFTAPDAGIYDFSGYVVWGTPASGFRYVVRVYKNGAPYELDFHNIKTTGSDGTDTKEGTSFSFLLDLTANDTVELYVLQYTGSNHVLGNWSYFSGHKVQ